MQLCSVSAIDFVPIESRHSTFIHSPECNGTAKIMIVFKYVPISRQTSPKLAPFLSWVHLPKHCKSKLIVKTTALLANGFNDLLFAFDVFGKLSPGQDSQTIRAMF